MWNAKCEMRNFSLSLAARLELPLQFRIPHLVLIRHLDRHPVLRNHCLLEHLPCLLHQFLGTDRITRGNVRQHQPPSLRSQRYLSCFARRRMPRLLGPLLLLLPKRRLVNQEISPLRRIDHRCTRTGITGEHHQPPRTLRAYNPLGAHLPPVRQLDRLAPLQLPPQVSFRNAGCPCLVGIEPPRTLVLLERVPDRSPTVLGPEYVNLVAVPLPAPRSLLPQRHPRLYLDDVDLERNALHPELKRLREQFLRPLWPIQPHRLRSHL